MGRGADRVHKCDPGRPYVYWQLPPVEERQNQSNRPTVRGGPVRSVGHPTQSLTTAHEHGIYPNRRFATCLVTHPDGLPTVTRPGRVANTPYQKPYPSAGGVCSRLSKKNPAPSSSQSCSDKSRGRETKPDQEEKDKTDQPSGTREAPQH